MRMFTLLIVLACSACVVTPRPMPVVAAAPAPVVVEEDCREFNTPVVIGGVRKSARGIACLQADGSWKINQSVAEAPAQAYTLVPRVYRPFYPPGYWADPWFYGPNLFLGGVFIGGGWGYEHRHPGWHGAWPPRRHGRR